MKKILSLFLSLLLIFGLAIPAYASDNDEVLVYEPDSYLLENDLPESEGWIQPGDIFDKTKSSSSIGYYFKKTASTKCKAQVIAGRPGASSIKSTIKVQIKNGSTYNTISNGTAVKSVSGSYINHIATFSISSRKTYRAKIAVQYVEDGATITDYYYFGLDSNGY